jgi:hypothetical protein
MQEFTGATTQTVVLPVVTTLRLGHRFIIVNNSTGTVTVNSSGGNAVASVTAGVSATLYCILITGTTAASWHVVYNLSSADTTEAVAFLNGGTGTHTAMDSHIASTANPHSVTAAQAAAIPNSGWTAVTDSWTYASASTITVPSGAASIYQVGDLIRWTQTTVKYGTICVVADTLLTIIVNTDYVVTNAAISAISYSRGVAPLGFPSSFNITLARSTLGTAPTFTAVDKASYSTAGRTITIWATGYNATGGTAGSGTNILFWTLPVTGVFLDTAYNGFEALGTGQTYEDAGTINLINIIANSATKIGLAKAATLGYLVCNDLSSTIRGFGLMFSYHF